MSTDVFKVHLREDRRWIKALPKSIQMMCDLLRPISNPPLIWKLMPAQVHAWRKTFGGDQVILSLHIRMDLIRLIPTPMESLWKQQWKKWTIHGTRRGLSLKPKVFLCLQCWTGIYNLLKFGRMALFHVSLLSEYIERRITSFRLQLENHLQQVFCLVLFIIQSNCSESFNAFLWHPFICFVHGKGGEEWGRKSGQTEWCRNPHYQNWLIDESSWQRPMLEWK